MAGPLVLDLDRLPDDDLGLLAVALRFLDLVGVRSQHVAHNQHLGLRGGLADFALVVAGQLDDAAGSLQTDNAIVSRLLPPTRSIRSMLVISN